MDTPINVTEKGILMVIARLRLSSSQYFPLENTNGIPRYVASIVPTTLSSQVAGLYASSNKKDLVIVDTKSKLLAKTIWK